MPSSHKEGSTPLTNYLPTYMSVPLQGIPKSQSDPFRHVKSCLSSNRKNSSLRINSKGITTADKDPCRICIYKSVLHSLHLSLIYHTRAPLPVAILPHIPILLCQNQLAGNFGVHGVKVIKRRQEFGRFDQSLYNLAVSWRKMEVYKVKKHIKQSPFGSKI